MTLNVSELLNFSRNPFPFLIFQPQKQIIILKKPNNLKRLSVFSPPCNNSIPSLAQGSLLPLTRVSPPIPPSQLSHCFIWTAVSIHTFPDLCMILDDNDKDAFLLLRNKWANMGTHIPSGHYSVTAQRERLLAEQGLCPHHASPVLTSSSSQHLVYTRTWFVMACGFQSAPEHHPEQQEDLAPDSPDTSHKPLGWTVATWSPVSVKMYNGSLLLINEVVKSGFMVHIKKCRSLCNNMII